MREAEADDPPRRRWALAVLLALVAGVLLAPTLVQVPSLRGRLVDLGLVRAPQSFVELSFTGPREIKKYVDWTGRLDVRFVVTSRLSSDTRLRWALTAAEAGAGMKTLQSGEANLAQLQTATLKAAGRVDCHKGRAEVAVSIRPVDGADFGPDEIHFWVVRDADVAVGGVKATSCKVP